MKAKREGEGRDQKGPLGIARLAFSEAGKLFLILRLI